MAFYHAHFDVCSRGKGHNAIASAAYRSASVLKLLDGSLADYSRKRDVRADGIIVPSGVSLDFCLDRQWVWQAAEQAEKRKNSCVARRGDLALPSSLSTDEMMAIGRRYAQDIANRYRVIVDLNFHDLSGKNPHIDIQWTAREFDGKKLTGKTRVLDDKVSGPDEIKWLRAQWASRINERLVKYGEFIDHRSFKDQGSEKLPQQHLGRKAAALERCGIHTEVGAFNSLVREHNALIDQKQVVERDIAALKTLKLTGEGHGRETGEITDRDVLGVGGTENIASHTRPGADLGEALSGGTARQRPPDNDIVFRDSGGTDARNTKTETRYVRLGKCPQRQTESLGAFCPSSGEDGAISNGNAPRDGDANSGGQQRPSGGLQRPERFVTGESRAERRDDESDFGRHRPARQENRSARTENASQSRQSSSEEQRTSVSAPPVKVSILNKKTLEAILCQIRTLSAGATSEALLGHLVGIAGEPDICGSAEPVRIPLAATVARIRILSGELATLTTLEACGWKLADRQWAFLRAPVSRPQTLLLNEPVPRIRRLCAAISAQRTVEAVSIACLEQAWSQALSSITRRENDLRTPLVARISSQVRQLSEALTMEALPPAFFEQQFDNIANSLPVTPAFTIDDSLARDVKQLVSRYSDALTIHAVKLALQWRSQSQSARHYQAMLKEFIALKKAWRGRKISFQRFFNACQSNEVLWWEFNKYIKKNERKRQAKYRPYSHAEKQHGNSVNASKKKTEGERHEDDNSPSEPKP